LTNKRPIIAITSGDPAGIGPEIIIKALRNKNIYNICRPLVIGAREVILNSLISSGYNTKLNPVSDIKDAKYIYGIIDILDLKNIESGDVITGQYSIAAGKIAFSAIKKAIELALSGKVDANVSCPINKKSINMAGYEYAGHTEIYADLTGTKDYAMMLAFGEIRVIHVSTHISLKDVSSAIKKGRVLKVIKLSDQTCKKLGIRSPRIGVAALNPHSGEEGLFGDEEKEEITPAVLKARDLGIDAEGPVPADIIFSKANAGMYDIVVAMYHDQGHIPVKLLGFKWNKARNRFDSVGGINITIGLPIIRTSVDHGTAFDIAGKGIASETSLLNAIQYAARLAENTGD